jgi:hypothetical protein
MEKIISYAVTVCNEIDEIKRLLTFLIKNKREQDEIVIFYDAVNGTKEVWEYLRTITLGLTYHPIEEHPIRWYSYDFDGDFSKMKNELTEMCHGDIIINIDADEIPHENLIPGLLQILELNKDNIPDLIWIPRINTLEGNPDEIKSYVKSQGWSINEKGWINWPRDFQGRIFKRDPNIRWSGKVHEKIQGHRTSAYLPAEENWALFHPKALNRQIKQNELYSRL